MPFRIASLKSIGRQLISLFWQLREPDRLSKTLATRNATNPFV
jgi:hypothetical protein